MQPVVEGHYVSHRRERIHAQIRKNMQMFGYGWENAQEWHGKAYGGDLE